MSEENPETPTPAPQPNPLLVTLGDVRAYLSEKRTLPCPSCGENKWHVIDPGEGAHGFIVFYPAVRPVATGRLAIGNKSSMRSFPVWNVMCASCGNVVSYASHVIEKWVIDKKTEGAL